MTSASALRVQTSETVAPAVAQVDTDYTGYDYTRHYCTKSDRTDTTTPGYDYTARYNYRTYTRYDYARYGYTGYDYTGQLHQIRLYHQDTTTDTTTGYGYTPTLRMRLHRIHDYAPDTTTPDSRRYNYTRPTSRTLRSLVLAGFLSRLPFRPSYIGVAGNIGLGEGDTALGESSFAVISIGLTPTFLYVPSLLTMNPSDSSNIRFVT